MERMTSIAVTGGVETENVSPNPTPKIITRCAITEIKKARWDLNTLEVEHLARDEFGIVTWPANDAISFKRLEDLLN